MGIMKWRKKCALTAIIGVLILITGGFPLSTDEADTEPFKRCASADCDPELDVCRQQECYYGECGRDGKCMCDDCWSGAACDLYTCGRHDESDTSAVHHRSKRAVTFPTNIEFTLTKSPDTKASLRIGEKIEFTLTIKFPNVASQQLLVELFTPDNDTTIMMLCDVRIDSVGSAIGNRDQLMATPILMEGKVVTPWPYDRAILNFASKVNCCTGTPSNDADISMVIKFNAVMYSDQATPTNKDYWVSAGAEYKDSSEIWVGQANFKYDTTAMTTTAHVPEFNLNGPTNAMIGIPFEMTLTMKIGDAAQALNIDVIAPLSTTSILSACAVLVSKNQYDVSVNYKCLAQTPFQFSSFKDADGLANGRVRLELSRVVNSGVNGGVLPTDASADIIELKIYAMFVDAPNGKVVPGNSYSIGAAVEIGTTQIWAGQAGVVANANTATRNTNIDKITASLISSNQTEYSPGSIVQYDLLFEVPSTSTFSSPASFQIEASMPTNPSNNAAFMGVCQMELLFNGWNVPCVVPPNKPVYTSTVPGGLKDKGVWNLGPLVNMQAAKNQTNSTNNQVIIRIFASVGLNVPPSTSLKITVGLSIKDNEKLWVADSTPITVVQRTATTDVPAQAVADAPTFNLTYTFDTNNKIPVNGVTDVQLEIKTKRSKRYSMMDLEIMMPAENDAPLMSICKTEVLFVGKNLPCLNKDTANASIVLKSSGSKGIIDRAILSAGELCNVGSYTDDNEDKFILHSLVKVLPSNTTSQNSYFSGGVMYSSSALWVGQTTLTRGVAADAKLNSTQASVLSLWAKAEDQTTTADNGVPKKIIVTIKLPPYSRSKYSLKVSTTSAGIVCAIGFVSAGDNFACEGFNDPARFPDPIMSPDRKTIELDMGVVTNPSNILGMPDDIFDNNTIQMFFFVNTKDPGSYSYDVSLIYQADSGGNANKALLPPFTITGQASTAQQTTTLTPATQVKVMNLTADTVSAAGNNVVKGQPVRFWYEINVQPGSQNAMELQVETPDEADTIMDMVNIGTVFIGKNIPCVMPSLPPYDITSRPGRTTMDIIKLNLGVCKHSLIDPLNITANLIRLEVVARIRSVMTKTSGQIPVKFTLRFNGQDANMDVKPIPLTLTTDPYTDTDSPYDNISLTFRNASTPYKVQIGQTYTLTAVATIPLLTSAVTTLDFEAPWANDTQRAKAVITGVTILSAGLNLAGLQHDTYTPTFKTVNNIQNYRAVVEMGIVTNTAFTQKTGTMVDADNEFSVQVTFQVADEDSLKDGAPLPISTGMKIGKYIVITDLTTTVSRSNSEAPKYQVNATVQPGATPKYSRGSIISVTMNISHQNTSSAEGLDAQVIVFMPPYMTYQVDSLVSTFMPDVTPTLPNPTENYLKFKWSKLFFPQVVSIQYKMALKPDAVLPSGLEAATLVIPYDCGSKMIQRTGNPDSANYIPSDMMYFSFDVTGLTPVSVGGGGGECTTDLGMDVGGAIKDCQLRASVEGNAATLARPNAPGWTPYVRGGQLKRGRYLEVYLGGQKYVISTVVLYRQAGGCYPTKIMPKYSQDGGGWWDGGELTILDSQWINDKAPVGVSSPAVKYIRVYITDDSCASGTALTVNIGLIGCFTDTAPQQAMQCTPSTYFDPPLKAPEAAYRTLVTSDEHVFFCDTISISPTIEMRCFRHDKISPSGLKFNRLSREVVNIIGYDTANKELYGLSRKQNAYLLSQDRGTTWKTVPEKRWRDAQTSIRSAIKVPWKGKADLNNGADPSVQMQMEEYGASFDGIYKKDGTSWTQIVDWSSCC